VQGNGATNWSTLKALNSNWLEEHKVKPIDFNQYGTRRGNHEVMMRGTFANIRLKNQMVPGVEGGMTVHFPSRQRMSIYDAAMRYKNDKIPLVIFAGKEYGSGSSRDWAAKGPNLLGVRAVITQSFERIHRSNLVGMGVLPLCFEEGVSWQTLGLKGDEQVTIRGLHGDLKPHQRLLAEIVASDGGLKRVPLICRIDTAEEIEYFKNGGVLHYVLRVRVTLRQPPRIVERRVQVRQDDFLKSSVRHRLQHKTGMAQKLFPEYFRQLSGLYP